MSGQILDSFRRPESLEFIVSHEQNKEVQIAMEENCEVFLFPSAEIQAFLADNHTDFLELLHQEGVMVKQGASKNPASSAATGHKEPSTVILATAALAVALTPLITKIIERLSRRTVIVQEEVPVALQEHDGSIVRDKKGDPIYRWVPRTRIVQEGKEPEATTVDIAGPLGIRISFQNEPKGMKKAGL